MYAERNRRPARTFTEEAYAALFAHRWPGNVRELQNVIERAVLLCKDEKVDAGNLHIDPAFAPPPSSAVLQPAVQPTMPAPPSPQSAPTNASTPAMAQRDLLDLCRAIINTPLPQLDGESMDMFALLEGPLVTAALERTKGNKQAAANLLGIYRPRLYSIIRKHGLREEGKEA